MTLAAILCSYLTYLYRYYSHQHEAFQRLRLTCEWAKGYYESQTEEWGAPAKDKLGVPLNPRTPSILERFGYPPVEDLSAVEINLPDDLGELIDPVAKLRRLRWLTLRAPSAQKQDLARLEELASVRAVDMSFSNMDDDDLLATRLPERVEFLDLTRTTIHGPGLRSLERLTHLRELVLEGTGVIDEGIGNLPRLPRLEVLSLVRTNVHDPSVGDARRLPMLHTLLLGWSETGPRLTNVGSIQTLTTLELSGTKIDDSSLIDLRGLSLLERLWLADTEITAAGLKNLLSLHGLRELELDADICTHQGIAALRQLPSLEELYVLNANEELLCRLRKELPNLKIVSADVSPWLVKVRWSHCVDRAIRRERVGATPVPAATSVGNPFE